MPKRPDVKAIALRSLQPDPIPGTVHPLRAAVRDENIGRVITIPIDLFKPNPHQPRKHFDEQGLQELAASLKKDGLLQPVVAYKDGKDSYTLICGERRLRAAKLAGFSKLPAYIREGVNSAELSITENVQREDLHPIDLAERLQELRDEKGYTLEQLASVISKSVPTVSQILSLNKLTQKIKDEYRTLDVQSYPKSLILSVVQAGGGENSTKKMEAAWEAVTTGQVKTVRESRKLKGHHGGRPVKNYVRRIPHPRGRFIVSVSFPKSHVTTEEVKAALKWSIDNLA